MHIAKLLSVLVLAAMALVALPSNAAESPDTASAAYQRKDYDVAYQLALPAAIAGDARAQHVLGLQLWRGRGVARNDADAARWLASAAEQNHSDAMTDLAAMYRQGEGVEKDVRRAFSLSMQAAELNNAAAQYDVGQAYQQGVGVSKDTIRARYWLERADAAESVQEAKRRPADATLEAGSAKKPLGALPVGCRPTRPPSYAMHVNNVTEVTGAIAMYIDHEARVRGVTARNVSVDALKYDVVALFSVALRSPECVITDAKRGVHMQIPFKFVVH
jgi:TPR repeat protein